MDQIPEDSRLVDAAAALAGTLRPEGERGARRERARLRRALERIRRCCAELDGHAEGRQALSGAGRWLLDNSYLARREGAAALSALRDARRLRQCEGQALILRLCRALVDSGAGEVSERRCRLFLDGFQSARALRRAELQAFPAMLRLALLEALAALCAQLRYAAEPEALTARAEAIFTSLRLFSTLDLRELLRGCDVTHAILLGDPTGDYGRMDRDTQSDYLRRLERLARREGLEEPVYARRLVKKARAEGRHLGFFLFSGPGGLPPALYIGGNVLLSLALSLLIAFSCALPAAAPLLLLPISELVKSALDALLRHLIPARRVPRMDLSAGVGDEGRTVCVISSLLGDAESARRLARRLEELRLCCRSEGEGLCFGLLADLPEAGQQSLPEDEAILEAARGEIRRLNRAYGGGFFLFSRPRCFDGERWTARERKRGALLALAALLCGEESELQVFGDADRLARCRFILTLDSDTRLYPGAAGELIGAALHPLNRPVFDEKRGLVTAGSALFQPRLVTELKSANATDFALIFAGPGGSEPYAGLCGELYMDAFACGGFAGKGLLDASLLLRCTRERIPQNRVLSHDALEGACLRGATLGDLCFSDAFPSRPLAYYRRLHRWVRGDWQNLSFVFCRDFTAMDRFRLFDSLRRSLLPPMTLLALLAGLLSARRGLAVAAWAALLALLSRLLLAIAEEGARPVEGPRLRRWTRLMTGVGGAIVQSFLRLWLLPYEAWICLSAALTALWRMGVSRKKLLQWQTAAQSESGTSGLWAHLRAMWPASLTGLALICRTPLIIGRAAGLLWLLSPLLGFALSLNAAGESPLSESDRDYLREAAAESFRYYSALCTPAGHGLPPDNLQEQPPLGPAQRSSPTNIGLALASAVAAVDLGVLEREKALALFRGMLPALETMPRCRGHYYNWYDTRTLQPLPPALVSTVDSGNFYASLTVLRQALLEWGEEALAARAGAILEPMSFAPLYDRRRGLLYIGYDPEKERGTGGWYDLMASEAMLTSYLAVAKGDVPVRHWERLSRAQLQKDGYRGLASWTGTMFEYLMPCLFLPLYRGSLLDESAKFCLYVQKRRAPAGRPWGVSESAFFALDAGLCYRYKANGCAGLALKRGQDEDLVVAPYASFLALAVDPAGAAANLRRLERLGMRGRFGFYEALDLSPGRCRGGDGERVRCWMAHHVGMSVVAAANVLCAGSIRRRFMGDPRMSAFSLLLQERLPESAAVLRRDREAPRRRPERPAEGPWRLRGEGESEARCLLSNGVYHLQADTRGRSAARYGEIAVYGAPELGEEGLRLRLLKDGLPLSDTPLRWELGEDRVLWEREDYRETLGAAAGEPGELRRLRLGEGVRGDIALTLSLRAILVPWRRWADHPAFWRLGLEAELADGALLLRRLRRGGQPELWLCLRWTPRAEADWDGERLLLRPDWGRARELSLALCLAPSRAEALDGALRVLESAQRADFTGAAALRLGMSAREIGEAMALLEPLSRPPFEAAPRRALWPWSISGDDPILCCAGDAAEALPLLKRWLLLKSCGLETELVYFSEESGEYRRPLYGKLRELLAPLGLEALLESPRGVHLLPRAAEETVRSRAVCRVGAPDRRPNAIRVPVLGGARGPGRVPAYQAQEDGFEMELRELPPRAWQLPLSNGRLGAVVCECGLSALWMENAHEERLIPPMEPAQTQGAELLWCEAEGRRISLFAANDGLPCRVRYEPGLAVWTKTLAGREIRTEVFIPPETPLRLVRVCGAEGLRLVWTMEPRLAASDASSLRCRAERGLLRAENPEGLFPELIFRAGTGLCAELRTDFCPPAMQLSLSAAEETLLVCGCAEAEELRRLSRPEEARAALERTRAFWRAKRRVLRVETGHAALDRYLNTWAVYQVLACRLWGRGTLYQSGGGYGFRDQLQDAVNLLPVDPTLARERILDACRHQYVEGDVMHWWHPGPDGDRGLRSRCSDDLLWLPWALCEYVEATGDRALCAREEPYCSSPPLAPEERDRYETPERGPMAGVLDHAKGALERCITRGFGPHGLPFFGSGDWNDGMDAVDGESAWLGWFFSELAPRFAALLESLGLGGARRLRELSAELARAADAAWCEGWYARGYWADGEPLGGAERIDALVQAWAALSGRSHWGRVRLALDAALERLYDREHGLVRLLDPPYGPEERCPGYLVGYGRGHRENGGQYTHAAVWLAMALLRRGRREEGLRLLETLLPENRDAAVYEAEPFVLPADVSAAPGEEGRAGWTWYTGSAGWFYRAALRDWLGLEMKDGELRLRSDSPALRVLLDGREIGRETE